MSKAVINNEIIILRKFVDQARIHTIKKLTRDVTKYKNKKGTDAQKAKNERKSKRLTEEILSIKKVKKDEITKHILNNNFNLKKILENQISSPLDRAMARIAHHKIFSKKIEEFKSKYPNYMEFMGPSRKSKAIREWKEKKKIKINKSVEKVETKSKDELEMFHSDELEDKLVPIRKTSGSSPIGKDNNKENNNKDLRKRKIKRIDEKSNSDLPRGANAPLDKTSSTGKIKKLEKSVEIDAQSVSSSILDEKRKNDNRSVKCDLKQSDLGKRNNNAKIISKQAIVKKLTDILLEDTEVSSKVCEKEVNSESTYSNKSIKKEVDSFFITGDERSYLSIAVSKDKDWNAEDDFNDNKEKNCNKRKFSRQQNDKCFSKVSKFQKNSLKFIRQWKDKKEYSKPDETSTLKLSNGEKTVFLKSDKSSVLDNKSVTYLHPSWEAKRKEQEILKKGFQGKKIIFGDDM